ncbi:MAG: small multi-drug export protein [Lawsonibacter sp.]
MELFQWLTDTTAGKCLFTMLVSMIPIIELRGGLPFGVALGLPYYLAFPAAVIGNIIPAPFIIVYIRRIFWPCAGICQSSTVWWTSWSARRT